MTTCNRCGYEWKNRKEAPKMCPRCKTRLDIVRKKKEKKNLEGGEALPPSL